MSSSAMSSPTAGPRPQALTTGLEAVPRRKASYRGVDLEEMDLDAVLARRPAVVLVDELAHTNVPGGRNEKRYQDVEELLAAGIHVISTLNIQHLESLYDMVEGAVGVKVRERVPDKIVLDADQIVNVDITTEDLLKRLGRGQDLSARANLLGPGFFLPGRKPGAAARADLARAGFPDRCPAPRPGPRRVAVRAGPGPGLPGFAGAEQRGAAALRLAPGGSSEPQLVRALCPDSAREPGRHRCPDPANSVRYPDPGPAPGGDGLHLQGRKRRRDHPSFRPGVQDRPRRHRPAASDHRPEAVARASRRRRMSDSAFAGLDRGRSRQSRRRRAPGPPPWCGRRWKTAGPRRSRLSKGLRFGP